MNKIAKVIIASITVIVLFNGCSAEKKDNKEENKPKVEVEDINNESNAVADKEKENNNSDFQSEAKEIIEKAYGKDDQYNESRIKAYQEYLELCKIFKEIADKENIKMPFADRVGKDVISSEDVENPVKQITWFASEPIASDEPSVYLGSIDNTIQFNDGEESLNTLIDVTIKLNDIKNEGKITLNENVKALIKAFSKEIDLEDVEAKANYAYETTKKEEFPRIKLEKQVKNMAVDFSAFYSEEFDKREISITLKKIADY